MKRGKTLPRSAMAATLLAATALTADAACWHDPSVSQIAQRIAQQGFPNAARNMPETIVCDAQDFGPGIGGDYTSGIHRIRVPAWQLGTGELPTVLAHELAHAEVALTYGATSHDGHSRKFFAALLRAGYHAEAERVAQYVGGGRAELQAALAASMPPGGDAAPPAWRPPRQWAQLCQTVPVAVRVRLPNGHFWVQQVVQVHCRLVPME